MEGWKSPIRVDTMVDDATKFISSKLEDDVWKAVLRCGIEVDKDELLRALRYDRDQWERGYEDGRMDGYKKRDAEIVRCGECKYRYKDGDNVVVNYCLLNHNRVQSDEWFCADAERGEDETD